VAEGTLMGLFDFFRKPAAANPALSADAQSVFGEVARDEKGELVKIRVPGQVIWDTNGKQFVDEKGPGKEGRWKAAIEELVAAGLIGPVGMRPYKLYLITKRGAAVAKSAATPPAT
jgi:hypothetical protein